MPRAKPKCPDCGEELRWARSGLMNTEWWRQCPTCHWDERPTHLAVLELFKSEAASKDTEHD